MEESYDFWLDLKEQVSHPQIMSTGSNWASPSAESPGWLKRQYFRELQTLGSN